MSGNFKLDDSYIDVAERIREFKAAYPDGTLQPVDFDNPYIVQAIGNESIIVYRAAAYRTPDDPRPGIGVASEPYPGRTPYTKGSEIQNAETSAWGRAIVALGIPTKRIASTEEVRNRKAEQAEDANLRTRHDAQREQAAIPPEHIHAAAEIIREKNGDSKLIGAAAQERLGQLIESRGRTITGVLAAARKRGIGEGLLETLTMGQAKKIAEAMKELPESAEADAAPEAPEAPIAATEAPAPEDGDEEPDADERRFLDETQANGTQAGRVEVGARKKGTVTPEQLTMLAALCAKLERLGVSESEWRIYLADEFKVASRTELMKSTTAPKAREALQRWIIDLESGIAVAGAGRQAVA